MTTKQQKNLKMENNKKIKREILAIGDEITTTISYREKLFEYSTFLANNGVKLSKINYSDLEKEIIPEIERKEILAILFFPQNFRNNNIEKWIKKDKIFGGNTHIKELDNYYQKMGNLLSSKFGDRLKFLNSPHTIKHSRDKRKIKKILIDAKISAPDPIYSKDIKNLIEISYENGLFIKLPGWGYGQGITRLKNGICKTNLIWEGNKINSDYNITLNDPIEITKPKSFLENLLEFDPLIEKEVDFIQINKSKFDLRMHIVGNPYNPEKTNVPFWFPRSNDPKKIVTNWCRGGEIRYDSDFRKQIPNRR